MSFFNLFTEVLHLFRIMSFFNLFTDLNIS
jgi:hypothetical protein